MLRKIKKQNRGDFDRRIKDLDPKFAALPKEAKVIRKPWEIEKTAIAKAESPILMFLLGFVMAIAGLFAVRDPAAVRTFLLDSGWPAEFISYAMNGVSFLVIGLVLFFLITGMRIINRRATGRWNAAGLVVGAMAALGMYNMPETYLLAALQYAGFESADEIFDYAHERTLQFASIDWASVVMVSSVAK